MDANSSNSIKKCKTVTSNIEYQVMAHLVVNEQSILVEIIDSIDDIIIFSCNQDLGGMLGSINGFSGTILKQGDRYSIKGITRTGSFGTIDKLTGNSEIIDF